MCAAAEFRRISRMSKTTRLLLLLACAVVPQAFAVPITYTLTGYAQANGGGTGPTPNTIAFTWTVNADTGSITNPSQGLYQLPAITSTMVIVGVKTTGITGVTVYLNTSTGTVTFGNIPGGGIGLTSPSLTSWNLASPIGPLNGPNVLVAGMIMESSGFPITLSGVANTQNGPSPTFQAELASPAITNVENSASNISQALPNSPIAQGSIFIVQGSDLGPANISVASAAFQSTTLGGTSVAVTVGGTTVNLPMYYSSAGQLAVLLPSNTPIGTGTITVTYAGSTSQSAPITVVANNPGIFTVDSSGQGPGIVTYSDYSLVSAAKATNCGGPNTVCGAANPGDTLILWATGLGPVNGDDTSGAGLGVAINVSLTLFLGGVAITPSYQGRSGCCIGEDQIVFTVPNNVPTGCAVPLVLQINGGISNSVMMQVAVGSRNCTATNPAYASQNLEQAAAAGQVGGYADIKLAPGGTGNPDAVKFSFGKITSYNAGTQPFFVSYFDDLAPGTCGVYNNLLSTVSPPAGFGNADAGSSFTIIGPNGTLTEPSGFSQLDSNGAFLAPGAFTVSGTGGADIGAFKANVTIPPAAVLTTPNPSNFPASITRSNGLTVAWTGGGANATVGIQLFGATDNTGLTGAQVKCYVPTSAGTFTIPGYILSALPAGNNGSFGFAQFAPEVPVSSTGLIDGEIEIPSPGVSFNFTLK